MTLKLVSLMAQNVDFLYREVAEYLSACSGVRVEAVDRVPWPEREAMLDRGEAQIAVICGLGYVARAGGPGPLEPLAAPVMGAPRYGRRAVYFSDVVVRRESPIGSFAELRGRAWAYNEPGSHSGYMLPRYHLAELGETRGYFGRVVMAGAHQRALRMIAQGEVDGAAIDSTVLELELARDPALAERLRVVATLGPSPIPPVVVRPTVPPPLRRRLRAALLAMHRDPAARARLRQARILRFVPAADAHYDPIRRMAAAAARVPLAAS